MTEENEQEKIPSLTDVLNAELQELFAKSMKYKELIQSAKTNAKKQLYFKKLKKNNKEIMRFAITLKQHADLKKVQKDANE